jgi:16S rRNA (guanine966-N2)-methyltransferase
MRIIGGSKKGFPLKRPKAADVRPTTDMIKEALFNILHPLDGKTFLDLFAGTGNVGIEALSRGASQVAFIEKNKDLARMIKDLAKKLGFEENARVISMDVKKGLLQLSTPNDKFDYVFIDPPYQKDLIADTIEGIDQAGLLTEDSLIVVQHSKREPVHLPYEGYSLEDQRTYGDSMLTFIKIKTTQADHN